MIEIAGEVGQHEAGEKNDSIDVGVRLEHEGEVNAIGRLGVVR